MPCDIEGHTHEWAKEGILYIQKCERICQFCEEETSERKTWQYPWFLRRHIRGVHGKQYPKLKVSQDWRPSNPVTPNHNRVNTPRASLTPQNKRSSPKKHDTSPTKRARVERRKTRNETPDTETSIKYDSDAVEDAATDGCIERPPEAVLTENTTTTTALIAPTPKLNNIGIPIPRTPSPMVTRKLQRVQVRTEEHEALRMRLYRIGIDPENIPNHPITIVPAHDIDPAPYVIQYNGQRLEDANVRFSQTHNVRMAYSDALLSLEYQGFRAGLTRHEMGIISAVQVDKMFSDDTDNSFCGEQLPSTPRAIEQPFFTMSSQSSPDIVEGYQLPPYHDPFYQPRAGASGIEFPPVPTNTPFSSPHSGCAPLPQLLTQVLDEGSVNYGNEVSTTISECDEAISSCHGGISSAHVWGPDNAAGVVGEPVDRDWTTR